MTMVSINNDQVAVRVHYKGAQLASIIRLSDNIELMWQADPAYWARHSCILFPVVGQMNNNIIHVDGVAYPMLKHGIVRDRCFDLVFKSESCAIFRKESDEETLQYYPFDFRLDAIYNLEHSRLTVAYKITNLSSREMPFCIGAHPAFKCPVYPDEKRSEYSLIFEKQEHLLSRIIHENGLFSGRTKLVSEDGRTIRIEDDLFDEDALIFSGLRSESVSLVNGRGVKVLRFFMQNFDQLGIWSKNDTSPFVCIEPWNGMADVQDYKGELKDKEGAKVIGVGETWSCIHGVEL